MKEKRKVLEGLNSNEINGKNDKVEWRNGAPRLSLTKYFRDRFSQVSLTIFFSGLLGYLDVAITYNSQNCMPQIYSTRLHPSFANFLRWLHINNLAWFYKRGKCQWNSWGICHIFVTIFAKWIATDSRENIWSVKVGWHGRNKGFHKWSISAANRYMRIDRDINRLIIWS